MKLLLVLLGTGLVLFAQAKPYEEDEPGYQYPVTPKQSHVFNSERQGFQQASSSGNGFLEVEGKATRADEINHLQSNNPFLGQGAVGSVIVEPIKEVNNPFIAGSAEAQVLDQPKPISAGNPFLFTGSSSAVVTTSIKNKTPQSNNLFLEEDDVCSGVNQVCVARHLCVDGYTSVQQEKNELERCEVEREVCCTIRAVQGTGEQQSVVTSQVQENVARSSLFGASNNEQAGLSSGEYSYETPTKPLKITNDQAGYLPPLGGEPSSNVPAYSQLPKNEDEKVVEDGESSDSESAVLSPAFEILPQIGCAAALLCVEEKFCTMQGVISPEPIELSSTQLLRRAPIVSCRNPETGITGKCCRDPNYVDPWPTGNLPANYTGGFDEMGFPNFLNFAKNQAAKKPKPTRPVAPAPTPTPLPTFSFDQVREEVIAPGEQSPSNIAYQSVLKPEAPKPTIPEPSVSQPSIAQPSYHRPQEVKPSLAYIPSAPETESETVDDSLKNVYLPVKPITYTHKPRPTTTRKPHTPKTTTQRPTTMKPTTTYKPVSHKPHKPTTTTTTPEPTFVYVPPGPTPSPISNDYYVPVQVPTTTQRPVIHIVPSTSTQSPQIIFPSSSPKPVVPFETVFLQQTQEPSNSYLPSYKPQESQKVPDVENIYLLSQVSSTPKPPKPLSLDYLPSYTSEKTPEPLDQNYLPSYTSEKTPEPKPLDQNYLPSYTSEKTPEHKPLDLGYLPSYTQEKKPDVPKPVVVRPGTTYVPQSPNVLVQNVQKPGFAQVSVSTFQTPIPQYVVSETPRPGFIVSQNVGQQFSQSQFVRPQHVVSETPRPQYVVSETPRPQYITSETSRPEYVATQNSRPQFSQSQYVRPQHVQTQAIRPQYVQTQTIRPQHVQTQTIRPRPVQTQTIRPQHLTHSVRPQHVVTQSTTQFTLPQAYIEQHVPGAQCGLRNKVNRPSSLNLEDVSFGEIPWQAMILFLAEKRLLCSGVIVSENAILTAAHCVDGYAPHEIAIKAGEWKLGYDLEFEEPYKFQIVNVSSIVNHPGYYVESAKYDLALLFLSSPIIFDQHIDSICLGNGPLPSAPLHHCISTGWGKEAIEVHLAGAVMHGIDLDVIGLDECRQRVSKAEVPIEVDETMVCTKARRRNNNVCQVDIGGPLACNRGDGYYELVGIYNQDTGCIPTYQVATFSLIDNDWVRKMLQEPSVLPFQTPYEKPAPIVVNSNAFAQAHTDTNGQVCPCQTSYLQPGLNQYLPPRNSNK